MRIVLRNNTTRKDAVYVVSAVGFAGPDESEYWVTGYWGPWAAFVKDTEGLRRQEKYNGKCKGSLIDTVQKLVTSKLCNNYKVVPEHSDLPEWPICLYGQRWQDYD